jgi:hypothetical protein
MHPVNPVFLQVVNSQSKLLFRSSNLQNDILLFDPNLSEENFFNSHIGDHRIRQGQFPIKNERGAIIGHLTVGISQEESAIVLQNLRTTLWIAFPLLLGILFLATALAASKGIAPVQVKTIKENLADAIAGESYEITTMYPEFLTAANAADNQLALTSLNYAYRTEKRHKPLYEKALTALQNNQLKTLSAEYYVCPACGNTYDSTPPKRCRISMTNGERFVKINAL